MRTTRILEAIGLHEAFRTRAPAERPLLGFWLSGYYPGEQFPSAAGIWQDGAEVRPQDIVFERFAGDYENLRKAYETADDDVPFMASPYWGIPWMEAIQGCGVRRAGLTCRAEHFLASPDTARPVVQLEDNPWFQALVRFTKDLVRSAEGRFPVCAPLLRGPGDCACAMLGGEPFIAGCIDQPDAMRSLLADIGRARIEVLGRISSLIPAWHGTYAAGGYPSRMWCRDPVAYTQEDSAALLSPGMFDEFLLPEARRACTVAKVNFIHLHSGCLYPLDSLLKDGCFCAIEINIDHPGGSVPPLDLLIPAFRRVQEAGVPLILWGAMAPEEWALVVRQLDPRGLSLQPIVKSLDEADAVKVAVLDS